MPFPLPTPEDLTRQQEGLMELSLRQYAEAKGLTVSPEAISRAVRSPQGMVSAIIRSQVQLLYTGHLHLRWWGDQYFPDTAELDNLVRHADIWGVFQRPATKAIGRVTFTGDPGLPIPKDVELRSSTGVLFVTTAPATIPAEGAVLVDVSAMEAGPSGNVEGGARLALVSPLLGLSEQGAIIDADGIAGGASEETPGDLLERLLQRIRQPPHGGAFFDYPVWVQNAFAVSHVRTLPNWIGAGSVGVCVAMGTKDAPRVPTTAELDAILDYLGRMNDPDHQGVRPVTAEVVMVPVELLPVPLEIRLSPDEFAVRQAVDTAVRAFFAKEATIGERMPLSRLSEAISAARGEYSHELIQPSASVMPSLSQLPVPGAITWNAA